MVSVSQIFYRLPVAGCGELVSVGEPVTHRKADNIEGKYGVWMQDPEAVSPYGPSMVWRIDTIGADVRKLFGYEDMEQLSKGFPSKVGVMIFLHANMPKI